MVAAIFGVVGVAVGAAGTWYLERVRSREWVRKEKWDYKRKTADELIEAIAAAVNVTGKLKFLEGKTEGSEEYDELQKTLDAY